MLWTGIAEVKKPEYEADNSCVSSWRFSSKRLLSTVLMAVESLDYKASIHNAELIDLCPEVSLYKNYNINM